jgi:hypothetical protein
LIKYLKIFTTKPKSQVIHPQQHHNTRIKIKFSKLHTQLQSQSKQDHLSHIWTNLLTKHSIYTQTYNPFISYTSNKWESKSKKAMKWK